MIRQIIRLILLFAGFAFLVGSSAYFTVVLLTKSSQTVIVPDLNGRHITHALELLTDLGLDIKVRETRYSHEVARNHVIFQDPEPGLEIKTGRDVQLVVSKGPQQIPMPDLSGDTLEQGRLLIEANGLRLDIVSETHADGIAENEIMAQSPPAGTLVNRETGVSLLVSRGARPLKYVMPDLSGLPFATAVMYLEEAGMILGRVTAAEDAAEPSNSVVSHDPLPGACITEGDGINLVINREAGPADYDAAGGGTRLFRHRLENGFLNRHIKVTMSCFGMTTDIYDQYQPPGSEIWVLVPSRRDATVLLYVDGELTETRVFNGW
ncbi:MAG: PASTA domain-containing protein [Desulfosudaceae bacterium]